MNAEFKNWLKSDNVIKVNTDGYKTQCTLYVPTFNLKELKKYFKKEYNQTL
jgi:hypothetical protein